MNKQFLADFRGQAAAFIRQTLFAEFLLLADHAVGQHNQYGAGKHDSDQKEKDQLVPTRCQKGMRSHLKISFGCDWLQRPWIGVVSEKSSRRTSVRLRAFAASALTTAFSLSLATKQVLG